MLGVLTGFAIIAAVVAVGYLVGRSRIAGEGAEYTLNRLAFFVATPALLFHTLAGADVGVLVSRLLAVAAASAVVTASCYVVVARVAFRRTLPDTVIGALCASYVNANNIGLPVAVYVLGAPTYVAPVLLIQLLVFAPFALTVLDLTSGHGASVGRVLSQPLRNPMIIAALAGIAVALTGWQPPAAVMAPLVLIGGAAVPLVLMAYGISLHGAVPLRAGTQRREVVVAGLLKVALMPAVAWLLARFAFGLTGHDLFVAVILAALPTAQNVYNFASRYQRQTVLARDGVLLASAAAVPAMVVIAALLT